MIWYRIWWWLPMFRKNILPLSSLYNYVAWRWRIVLLRNVSNLIRLHCIIQETVWILRASSILKLVTLHSSYIVIIYQTMPCHGPDDHNMNPSILYSGDVNSTFLRNIDTHQTKRWHNPKSKIWSTYWLWTGFGLVIVFIELLQIVTTGNYSAIANSHNPQFSTVGTIFSQSTVSSPIVAWWRLPSS
jgi:hypothetical protein